MPRSESQRRALLAPSLSWRKWKLYFAGVRPPASNPYMLCRKSFLGNKSQITSASTPECTASSLPAPPPTPLTPPAGSLASYLTLPVQRPLWQEAGNRAAFTYLYIQEIFSSETHFRGSSIFEGSHFHFSPAASSKLTTKVWCRRTKINGIIVFQFFEDTAISAKQSP